MLISDIISCTPTPHGFWVVRLSYSIKIRIYDVRVRHVIDSLWRAYTEYKYQVRRKISNRDLYVSRELCYGNRG